MTIAAQFIHIFLSVFAIGAALFAIVGTAGARQQTRSLRDDLWALERHEDLSAQLLDGRLEKLEDDKALRDAAKEKDTSPFGDMTCSEILDYLEQQIDVSSLGDWVAKAIAQGKQDASGLAEVAKRLAAVEAHVETAAADAHAINESITGLLPAQWTVKTETDSAGRTYVAGIPSISIGVNNAVAVDIASDNYKPGESGWALYKDGTVVINGALINDAALKHAAGEPEVETFKRLAAKYLIGELREVHLLSDPPQTRFEVKGGADG